MKQNKGISLIVLIITIIIIIILAGAVILTLTNSNIIGGANKAVFLNDMTSYRSQLSLTIADQILNEQNTTNIYVIPGDSVDGKYTILQYLPGMKKEYLDFIGIENSKIIISGNAPQEWQEWFKGDNFADAILENITSIKDIAVSNNSCFIKTEQGKIYAWGLNANGQLGIGNTVNQITPVEVTGIENVKEIISSTNTSRFVYAIKEDNSVWGWGYNNVGQLGNGKTAQINTPAEISNLTGLTGFSVGTDHTLAITSNGTVKSWGYNHVGQLGIGNTASKSSPIDILGLTNIKQVAAGGYFSLALTKDGKVYAWGANENGQLGQGNLNNKNTPVLVEGLTNIKKIAAGFEHTLALTEDGKVYSWGKNGDGEIGNNTIFINVLTPTLVPNLSNVKDISASYRFSVAVLEDGSVYGWGKNEDGQLGCGDFVNKLVPTKSNISYHDLYKLCLTGYSMIGLAKDNTLKTVGINTSGQLGMPLKNNNNTEFKKIDINNVDSLYTGTNKMIVKLKDNTYKGWGSNVNAQLGGISKADYISRPTKIPSLETLNMTKLIAKGGQSFIMMTDGTVKGFGANWHGSIGIGNNKEHIFIPVDVPDLKDAKDIFVSLNNSVFAIMKDNSVKGWGKNQNYSIGLGDLKEYHSPTTIPNLVNVKTIYPANMHTIALLNDDSTMVWGYNNVGQFGIGNTITATTPVKGPNLQGLKQLVVGNAHTLALMQDGTVKAWGYNNVGQLGIGNTTNKTVPTVIPELTNVKELFAYGNYSMAILNDGTLKVWGANESGQLGLGNTNKVLNPTTLQKFKNVKQLGGNDNTSFILLEDGSLYASGSNQYGNLANGQIGDRYHTFLTIGCEK